MKYLYKTLLDTFQSCERKGYLSYLFLGKGVERDIPKSFELSKGIAIHKGIETIWAGGDLCSAVNAALAEYEYEMREATLPGSDRAALAHLRTEHAHLIEGVLNLWYRARYQVLLADFEIVGTEMKALVPLTGSKILLAKPDAILRSKLDGRFTNWSLKTEKAHSRMKHPAALIDTGGLTEAIAAAYNVGEGDLRSIAGTMMEYLVVGTLDTKEDPPIIWHPTIHGWTREAPDVGGTREYAWRYKFDNPDWDPLGPKSPSKNAKERSLGKGWTRFDATDYVSPYGSGSGIPAWVIDLIARRFLPNHLNPLDELILAPPAYTRSQSAIASFLRKTMHRAKRWDENLAALEAGTLHIDEAFEQNTDTCLKYGESYRCPYWAICFEGAGVDPLNQGYRVRATAADREKIREEYEKAIANESQKPESDTKEEK